jgi:hypothetical protein
LLALVFFPRKRKRRKTPDDDRESSGRSSAERTALARKRTLIYQLEGASESGTRREKKVKENSRRVLGSMAPNGLQDTHTHKTPPSSHTPQMQHVIWSIIFLNFFIFFFPQVITTDVTNRLTTREDVLNLI